MKTSCTLLFVISLGSFAAAAAEAPLGSWPHWRGPKATGEAPGNPPTEWSEAQNVRWKVEIPGKGLSTPVVWGDKIFLTTAVPAGEPPAATPQTAGGGGRMPKVQPDRPQRFVVLALDRTTGKLLWERTAREAVPHEGTHQDGSWASPSPATDGALLYVSFGSHGLYAYDLDGNLKWSTDLGDMKTRNGFGEGSSPALAGDVVVVNWDHENGSFIVALDRKSGVERWRQTREEVTSWSTPLPVEVGGKTQVVVSATGRTRGYDAATGEVLWQAPGMTTNAIPTPVHADGVVFVTSGFQGNALQAIRLAEARGEVTGPPALLWSHGQDTPYVPSPALYDGTLYFLKRNNGFLSALDAKTGAVRYGSVRLDAIEGVYASPVAASGRLYIAGRNGKTVVIKAGAEFQVLATNTLDDRFDASPVVLGDDLLLRGHRYLYLLGGASK
jgi:outer membrane protein assembly factor BamB